MEKRLDFESGTLGLEFICSRVSRKLPRQEIGFDECSQELKGRCAISRLLKSQKRLIQPLARKHVSCLFKV
jgi:hypothetical protein